MLCSIHLVDDVNAKTRKNIMKKIITIFLMLMTSQVNADFITFTAEVNSGGSPKIVIDNRSHVDFQMIRATFDFNGTPVVLQTPGNLGFGLYGSYQTANTAGGAASLSGISKTSSLIQFDFSGVTAGNGYGVAIDIGNVRNEQINGATIEALFRHVRTSEMRSLSYKYDRTGNGRSFPAYATASVPEPGIGIISFGFLGSLLSFYRKKHNQ